jgi:hypothetical protein
MRRKEGSRIEPCGSNRWTIRHLRKFFFLLIFFFFFFCFFFLFHLFIYLFYFTLFIYYQSSSQPAGKNNWLSYRTAQLLSCMSALKPGYPTPKPDSASSHQIRLVAHWALQLVCAVQAVLWCGVVWCGRYASKSTCSTKICWRGPSPPPAPHHLGLGSVSLRVFVARIRLRIRCGSRFATSPRYHTHTIHHTKT